MLHKVGESEGDREREEKLTFYVSFIQQQNQFADPDQKIKKHCL